MVVQKHRRDDLQDAKAYEKPYEAPVFSSDLILNGYYDNEKRYGNFLAELNYGKAEKHIQSNYYREEKLRRKREKEQEEQKLNTKRRAVVGAGIAQDVARARYEATKQQLAFTVKLDDPAAAQLTNKQKRQKNVINFELEQLVGDMRRLPRKKNVYEEAKDSDDEAHAAAGTALGEGETAEGGVVAQDHYDSSSSSSSAEEEDGDGEGRDDEAIDLDIASPGRPLRPVSAASPSNRLAGLAVGLSSLPSFFRQSSAVHPAETVAAARKTRKSKSAPQRSWMSGLRLPELEDVAYFLQDSRKALLRLPPVAFLLKDRRLTEPHKTATALRREVALAELKAAGEVLLNPKYVEERMELAPHELTEEEFRYLAKGKRRELRLAIHALDRRNAAPEERHQLAKLRRRLELLEEMVAERQQRREKAVEMIELMKEVLEDRYEEVAAVAETRWERAERWLVNKLFYSPLKHKKMPSKLEALLPDPRDLGKQTELATYLLRSRFFERNQLAKSLRLYYKLLRLGRSIEDLEDKLEAQRRAQSCDDLVFACQAGDYRKVIDVLDYRESLAEDFEPSPVQINDISSDGMTATYSTLMMILNKEVLDTDANFDDLFLSPFQLRKKKLLRALGLGGRRGAKVAEAARFDYILALLLFYGGDLNFPKVEFGKDGLTVLHQACLAGALEMVRWLLARGVDVNQLSTLQLRTPLMFAVERDRLEVALFLLKEGAVLSVHHVDALGNNVLHYAALHARPLLVQLLLICGARSNVRNKAGYLAAEEAKMKGRHEVAAAILTFKDDLVDHRLRIDFLLRGLNGLDRPDDQHTGKFSDLPAHLDQQPATPLPPEASQPPAGQGQGQEREPGSLAEGDEEEEDEAGDVFPVEADLDVIGLGNPSANPSGVSTKSDESASTKRVNSIWAAIQRPLRTAYSSPQMSVTEHLQQVKAEHASSAPSLLPRINVPLAAIGRLSSVVGPVLAGDGLTKKEKAATPNAETVVKAPRLRQTILQLSYSAKTKAPLAK